MNKVIGIDLGGTNLKSGVVSDSGEILHLEYQPAEAEKGPKQVIKNIVTAIQKTLQKEIAKGVSGIGLGIPGQIDLKTGIVYDPPNFPDWHAEDLAKVVGETFGLNVKIDNDANVAALGESVHGAGKDSSYFVLVTLGTGVGSGIILNDKIYHGATGAAGEFGHMTIRYDGPVCNCGNKGCIERYIGAQWIVERAVNYLSDYPDSQLHHYMNNVNEKITPKTISDLEKQGDALSRRVIQETGNYLGIALGSLVNVLNLDLLLIGGGIANTGAILFDAIHESFEGYSLSVTGANVEIRRAALGEYAGVIGAGQLIFDTLADWS